MADKKIKNEFDYDYRLVGIAATLKEYKLCFHLNSFFGCDFRKLKDLVFETSERERNVFFSVFKGTDADKAAEFLVFANKNGTDTLLPEAPTFDFILLIRGKTYEDELQRTISFIKQLTDVMLCAEIPLSKVKNHHRLIYEEEKPSSRPLFKNRFGIKK